MTSPIKTPTHRAICTTGGSGTAAGASTLLRDHARFCSEFGYQAFPCQNTVDFYVGKNGPHVTSPVMELHQKNNAGNSKIVEMFTRYFRLPSGSRSSSI